MSKIEYDDDGTPYNSDTGEVIKKRSYGNTYFQCYPGFWDALQELGGAGIDVLSELVRWFPSNSVEIVISSRVRGKIMKRLDCSKSKVDRGIAELVDAHLLIHQGRGSYQINPEYIWKGYWGARMDEINKRPIGFKNKK